MEWGDFDEITLTQYSAVDRDEFRLTTEMVLQAGLEPARSFEQKILSLLCLPIPPPEQVI